MAAVCTNGHEIESGASKCGECGARIQMQWMAESPSDDGMVALEFVTTLPELPGYVTTQAHGIVADVGSGAGKTARAKGVSAFRDALEGVRRSARSKGGNAIVGLQITGFGTSLGGMLGDAVGTTLLGTAVTVVADAERPSPE